jgi:ubiquitin-protein ligase
MNPRYRRLLTDFNKVIKEFENHQYISVTHNNEIFPPEKYIIKYNGIKSIALSSLSTFDNKIVEEIKNHILEINLNLNYPRYKPVCYIKTKIFHPNFRNAYPNEVCIGDFWAPGEDIVDIIYKIGDMIQFKIYNVKSPLNGVAAKWAKEHLHLFPLDNTELRIKNSEKLNAINPNNIEINIE